MDKLYAIKIRQSDGTYGDEIPINVLAQNVDWDSSHTLVDILGVVDTTSPIQNQINNLVNTKASQADVNLLETRVDNIIANAGDDNTEIVDARVGADGTQYTVLKNRLDTEHTQLKSALDDVGDVLNVSFNVFNALTLEISSPSNWEIVSKTPTSITVKNKTGFSTGYPKASLSLPAGDYIFSANFSQSSVAYFQLYKNASFAKQLLNNTEFTIESGATYEIRFVASAVETYTITDISIKSDVGANAIDRLDADVASIDSRVDALENSVEPVYGDVEADSTTANLIITNAGTTSAAGSEYYLVKKYTVEGGKTYRITGSTAWGNLIYAFYDSADGLLLKGTRADTSGTDTVVTEEEATAPPNASYLLVAYHTTSLATSVCETIIGYISRGGYPVRWEGKKWVCVGDSLTAINDRTTKHYFDYVAESTGITVVNMGLSGTGYARRREQNEAFYQRISACPTDADVVTIFGSFNDIGAGLPIGSVDDTGTDSLAGCINTTITNLQTIIPLVNLGIVAPTPWDTTQPPATVPSAGQLNAYNYVGMIKAICERRSIPFLDLWRESNLRPWDADFRAAAYSKDGGSGTHPDENGHKLIAPRFKGFLETLLL